MKLPANFCELIIKFFGIGSFFYWHTTWIEFRLHIYIDAKGYNNNIEK